MKKYLLFITLMTTMSVGANAQAVLKSIGDKAKQKVEKSIQKKIDNKVDQAIDGAVNRIFGIDNSKTQETQESTYAPASNNFAQGLLDEYGPGWGWDGDEETLPTLQGSNLKDMISFMPEIPAAEVLVTEKGWNEFDKAVKIASKSAEALTSKYMVKMASYSQNSQAYRYSEHAKLEAIYEELTNMFQAETELLVARQQATLNNVIGALGGSTQTLENGSLEGALGSLDLKVKNNWAKSDECRKVNQLQKDKKTGKEQNEAIDAYNLKTMKKWIETIKTYQEVEKASVMRIVEIESELEAMSAADKSNPLWNRCMLQVANMSNKVFSYTSYPSQALSCPMVHHVVSE